MSEIYYVKTPPSGLVISLSETKHHLRVDDYSPGAQASKTFGSGNSKLVLTAKYDGTYANTWRAVLIQAGSSTPLSVSYASDLFTVNLATDVSGNVISTPNDVIAKLLNDPLVVQKINATPGDGNGTGIMVAAASAQFSGGVDGASYDDTEITAMIYACQEQVETILRKRLLTQTMTRMMRGFPGGGCDIELEWGKVQSVAEVRYVDQNDQDQTLSGTFELNNKTVPARVELEPSESWPYVNTYRSFPLEIDFVVGYGGADDVPYAIKLAMKLMIGHWYTNRESVQVNSGIVALVVPKSASSLLATQRDFRF